MEIISTILIVIVLVTMLLSVSIFRLRLNILLMRAKTLEDNIFEISKIVASKEVRNQRNLPIRIVPKPEITRVERGRRARKVYQYSAKSGEFINEWRSANAAAKALNLTEGTIRFACRNQDKITSNSRWSYNRFDKLPSIEVNEKSS